MSRKGSHRLYYYDDYDVNDDYDDDKYDAYDDDDDDSDAKENGKISKADHAGDKPGVWHCSVCSYDNDESSYSCDICGVFREPSVSVGNKSKQKAAVPFKFDSPSPDDLVSAGKQSSGTKSKDSSISLPKAKKQNESKLEASTSGLQMLSVDSNSSSLKASILTGWKTTSYDQFEPESWMLPQKEKAPTRSRRKTISYDQYEPEPWMLPDKEKDGFCQLNLAIVGHVDSGKSTLSGRLLHLLGRVSQKQMHKYEKEAKILGKESFTYAWALDESTEERERGVTMTVAVAHFDTKKYHVVVLDSPGHKDFVPNMISGATQADAAILVIDASIGAFEAGMEGHGGGQTKEHAQLIRSFGVEQVIVAVNKMDTVEYSQERFNHIKSQLGLFLRSCGFKESSISWVPLSAMENQNLVSATSDAHLSSWYRGPYLLSAIDSLQPPAREFSKPLRMPICEAVRLQSSNQVAASGKLEAGAIRNGSKVLVMPYGDLATVQSMEQDSHKCAVARAGDNVSVSLNGVDSEFITKGGVLCDPDFPVARATCLELKVLMLETSMPIVIGSQVEFHVHHAKEAGRVVKILSVIDKLGKVSKKAPRCLVAKQSAMIEVALDRGVCVEEFSMCKALGRVFLRSSGKTIAVGIISRIVEDE